MTRVIAVDDEPLALRQLATYISQVPELKLVAQCQSALEAAAVVAREEIDAVFCDINMPDLSGLDFVRSLSAQSSDEAPLVVFTTAYSHYAIEGFEVAAVDYLLKPYSISDFRRATDRLLLRLQQRRALQQTQQSTKQMAPESTDVLYVRADHRTQAIAFTDIRYIQAMGEYLRIYVDSQPRPITSLLAMKRIESQLPTDRFMRIHRSHIINLNRIAHVARGRVTMADGTELPIGDNYRAAFEAWMLQRKAS